jgi:hypothetical protein
LPAPKAKAEWKWDKVAKHKGPKLGKFLRREFKEHFHALYELTRLLRLLDPSFAEEMTRLKLDRAWEVAEKLVARELAERRGRNAGG